MSDSNASLVWSGCGLFLVLQLERLVLDQSFIFPHKLGNCNWTSLNLTEATGNQGLVLFGLVVVRLL
jgi:hypothetical protein